MNKDSAEFVDSLIQRLGLVRQRMEKITHDSARLLVTPNLGDDGGEWLQKFSELRELAQSLQKSANSLDSIVATVERVVTELVNEKKF